MHDYYNNTTNSLILKHAYLNKYEYPGNEDNDDYSFFHMKHRAVVKINFTCAYK